ncbi:MAG: hypothetical protein KDB27_17280 [Planctomycetales bacterium]|nr:hypothetical protein [Planctomycetales bacterium]
MKLRKRITTVCVLIVIAVSIAYGVITIRKFGDEFANAWNPTNDMSRFEESLTRLRDGGYAKHFPDALDGQAIAFYFDPGPLQAPTVLQLRCNIDSSDLENELKRAQDRIRDAKERGKTIYSSAPRPYFYATEHDSETGRGQDVLPAHWVVYMHIAEDRGQNSFAWNHGWTEGVAFDEKAGEILYFTELW